MTMEDEIADFSGLGDFLNMPIHTCSTGMHMRFDFTVTTAVWALILVIASHSEI
jgi:lipopolysaccharide transport system ATP-binding protein